MIYLAHNFELRWGVAMAGTPGDGSNHVAVVHASRVAFPMLRKRFQSYSCLRCNIVKPVPHATSTLKQLLRSARSQEVAAL